jgi:hypothetical protein
VDVGLADRFADGVQLVEVVTLAGPGLVARAVGAALGVRERGRGR